MENYEKLKKIGKGTFGIVHLVQSKVDQKVVLISDAFINKYHSYTP